MVPCRGRGLAVARSAEGSAHTVRGKAGGHHRISSPAARARALAPRPAPLPPLPELGATVLTDAYIRYIFVKHRSRHWNAGDSSAYTGVGRSSRLPLQPAL